MRKITKSEAYELLKNKKIFVGNAEISEQVQKQLFKAGFRWVVDGTRCAELNSIFLFTNEDGIIMHSKCNTTYYSSNNEEISAMEILSWEIIEDKPTFKVRQEVLMRYDDSDKWTYCIYSHYDEEIGQHVSSGGIYYEWCIPYEGNEDLLGTTNQPK